MSTCLCERCVLSNVLTLLKDGTHNPPKRHASGVPLITGVTIKDNFINYEKATYISVEDYSAIHKKYQPATGDLILTKIGTVGKVAILRSIDLPIAVHCNSALLRFDETKIPSEIGFWMLNSEGFKFEFNKRISKTVQDFVSLKSISEIPVSIPLDLNANEIKILKTILQQMSLLNYESSSLSKMRECLLNRMINNRVFS